MSLMGCFNYPNGLFEIQVKLPKNWVLMTYLFLNQARAGLWPARVWFLRIASVCESMRVCVSAPEAINN